MRTFKIRRNTERDLAPPGTIQLEIQHTGSHYSVEHFTLAELVRLHAEIGTYLREEERWPT